MVPCLSICKILISGFVLGCGKLGNPSCLCSRAESRTPCCEEVPAYFSDKIARILSELFASKGIKNVVEGQTISLLCLSLSLARVALSGTLDILGALWPSLCTQDPGHCRLVKVYREKPSVLLIEIFNVTLRKGT